MILNIGVSSWQTLPTNGVIKTMNFQSNQNVCWVITLVDFVALPNVRENQFWINQSFNLLMIMTTRVSAVQIFSYYHSCKTHLYHWSYDIQLSKCWGLYWNRFFCYLIFVSNSCKNEQSDAGIILINISPYRELMVSNWVTIVYNLFCWAIINTDWH